MVLSADEVSRVLAGLSGEHLLLARLLYGTRLRITEALQLRVKALALHSARRPFVRA